MPLMVREVLVGARLFVERDLEVVALQQVLALVPETMLVGDAFDLGEEGVVLAGELRAVVRRGALERLVAFALADSTSLVDRGDTFVGGLQGLDRLALVVEEGGEVVGTVVEARTR